MQESGAETLFFVGIDGGGSKCRARLETMDGEFLGSGLGGPANPHHGVDRTKESIITAINNALSSSKLSSHCLSQLIVGAGLAGLHLPNVMAVMKQWQHPFKALYVTNDLEIACLGAHRGADGAVIVTGTGSSGYCSINQQTLTLGARGFMVGDQGSGAWIGLEAVKAVLLAFDNLGPQTQLSTLLQQHTQKNSWDMIDALAGASASAYAEFAPLVFAAANQGDAVASDIVCKGSEYIENMVEQFLALKPPRVSMIGGISALLKQELCDDISAKISPPLDQPEQGAIYFARAQYLAQYHTQHSTNPAETSV